MKLVAFIPENLLVFYLFGVQREHIRNIYDITDLLPRSRHDDTSADPFLLKNQCIVDIHFGNENFQYKCF